LDGFDTFPVWPLRSTGVTPLPRYYGPLRLPVEAACRVMDSPAALRACPHLVGSPRFLGHSFGMRPPQPPRLVSWMLSLVSSPRTAGFVISGRLTTSDWRNEAESGSLSLGLTPLLSKGVLPSSPPSAKLEDRPAPRARLPSHKRPQLHVERAIDMANTFQLARMARLNLAHQRTRRDAEERVWRIPLCVPPRPPR